MSDWQTYRLEDFIPFTPEVYWRLLERINETFWPLHILTIALGIAALLAALCGNPRIALILLAPAWLTSGAIFHLTYYAELNWAAPWFGRAFITQTAVLLVIAAFARRNKAHQRANKATTWIGTTITILALLAYPLIAATLGPGPAHAETFGLHPDPTAIATLGILLIAMRGMAAWLSILIPFLWCLIATLTLIPLEAAWAALPLAVAMIAGIRLVTISFEAGRYAPGKLPEN